MSIRAGRMLALDIAIFASPRGHSIAALHRDRRWTLLIIAGVVIVTVAGILASGFTQLQPNIAPGDHLHRALRGTVRRTGFVWTVPLTTKPSYSLRVRNFESETLKVNDAMGNPIEVAAVVVWRVIDTAKAAFEVDNYEPFVRIQTETAIRHMASEYPYDVYTEGQISLRANADEVMGVLKPSSRPHDRDRRRGRSGSSCAGWPTPRRSRRTCSAASRPRRSSRPAAGSWRARSAWSRGARAAEREADRYARRGAQGGDGVEPARRPLQRARHPAGRERRDAVPVSRSLGRTEGLPAADRPAPLRRAREVGGGRAPQRERPDRVPLPTDPPRRALAPERGPTGREAATPADGECAADAGEATLERRRGEHESGRGVVARTRTGAPAGRVLKYGQRNRAERTTRDASPAISDRQGA